MPEGDTVSLPQYAIGQSRHGAIFRKNNQLDMAIRETLSEEVVFGLSPEG